MNLVRYLLLGEVTPEVRAARKRAYHRRYWHSRDDLKVKDRDRKREKYATDAEYREQRKAAERERRRAMTPEQRAANYQRRKARDMELTPEEYERRRLMRNEAARRWKAKKKESTIVHA